MDWTTLIEIPQPWMTQSESKMKKDRQQRRQAPAEGGEEVAAEARRSRRALMRNLEAWHKWPDLAVSQDRWLT